MRFDSLRQANRAFELCRIWESQYRPAKCTCMPHHEESGTCCKACREAGFSRVAPEGKRAPIGPLMAQRIYRTRRAAEYLYRRVIRTAPLLPKEGR